MKPPLVLLVLGMLCLRASADYATLSLQVFPSDSGTCKVFDIHTMDHSLVNVEDSFHRSHISIQIPWPAVSMDTAIACVVSLTVEMQGGISINVPVLLEKNKTVKLLIDCGRFHERQRMDERLYIRMSGTPHALYMDSLWKAIMTSTQEMMAAALKIPGAKDDAILKAERLELLTGYKSHFPGSPFWKSFLHSALATERDEAERNKLCALLDPGLCQEKKSSDYLDSLLCSQVNRSMILPTSFEFVLPDKNNRMINAGEFRGKILFVEFWATWCGPCLREQPALRKLYEAMKNKDLAFVSISLDKKPAHWKSYLEKNAPPWTQLIDDKGIVAATYGIASIPYNLIVDEKGNILAKQVSIEEARDLLYELLQDAGFD